MSDKPREWWIAPGEGVDSGDLYFGDALTKHPNQGPLQWQSMIFPVVEKSAYAAERERADRLEAELAEAKALKDKAADIAIAIGFEHNQKVTEIEKLQAKLAEVEASLTREREAARVMREAWRQSLELFTPNPGEELTEYGEGAKQTIEQMREQYEEALTKADEIRGGE